MAGGYKKTRNISVKKLSLGVLIGFGLSTSLGSGALAHTKTSHHTAGGTHVASQGTSHSTHVAAAQKHGAHVASSHQSSHSSSQFSAANRSHYASVEHRYLYANNSHGHVAGHYVYASNRHAHANYRYSGLQCVPYAREVSHIELSGNAFLWWPEAAGRYARGTTPVEGAVLNFRAIRRMPLGHVAVVTAVVDSRTILVTQANWIRGTITNDVTMQDVSPNNDWSQVQVELGDTKSWGAAYPTYGFIYNQPASSTVIASNNAANTEVAEAPRSVVVQTSGPNHSLQ